MKRIAALLFLAIFLLNMAGVYVYFIARLYDIKAEMRLALKAKPAEELEVLELTVDGFQQARVDEHEIELNGNMYDIARIEKQGNHLVIYCLHDEAEDNLLSLLDSMLKNASKDKKQAPVSGMLFLLAFVAKTNLQLPALSSFASHPCTFYSISLMETTRTVLGPPPRG